MAMKRTDLAGRRYSRWTVISFAGGKAAEARWLCRCDCGTERPVLARSLNCGASRSCGCLHDEMVDRTMRTHGMTRSSEFRIWQGMNQRCYNPKGSAYRHYGGRGIAVCPRWRGSFEAFYADMGPRPSPAHSLDRIDNGGPYSPENCRWATVRAQAWNRRTNVTISFRGETKTIAEWAAQLGLSPCTIRARLNKGWPAARVLNPAVDERRSRASRSRPCCRG